MTAYARAAKLLPRLGTYKSPSQLLAVLRDVVVEVNDCVLAYLERKHAREEIEDTAAIASGDPKRVADAEKRRAKRAKMGGAKPQNSNLTADDLVLICSYIVSKTGPELTRPVAVLTMLNDFLEQVW